MKRVCPLAEKQTQTKVSRYSKQPWIIKECQETGMVYLENPPEYERLESDLAWEKNYEIEKLKKQKAQPIIAKLDKITIAIRHSLSRTPKLQNLAVKIIRNLNDKKLCSIPAKILDLGCGKGARTEQIVELLRTRFNIEAIPYGIDISKALAAQANERFSKYNGFVIQAPAVEALERFRDINFDCIIMCSFLEHEISPKPLLRLCHERLTPAGCIIIKVPNYASWNRRIRRNRWCGFRYPDHVNYFTPATLKRMLKETSFKIIRMNFFDRIPTSDSLWTVAAKANQ